MESSSSSGNAKQRSLAKENSNLNVNDFLDENTSKNTKKLMNQTVSTYNQTMHSLNMKEGSDSYKLLDETPVDELPNNICKFFMVVVKMDGSKFNASSLNTFFRMLIRYLKMRDENPVDISTDIRFKKCSEVVKARSLESAKAGKRPGINSAQSLTTQQLKQLMESDGMSRDNPRGLISLVHYILMTGFGCRARDECRAITNGDVVFGPESSIEGLPQYLSLSERITKTRRGSKNDKRDVEGRVYLDQDFPKLCPVRTLLYYQSKKTPRQLEKNFAFLLSVKQKAEKDPLKEVCWYTDHPMGVNYIGALFKNAVSKAGIDIGDKKVTATTARKNLAQSGAEGGVPSTFLSKMLAQKNMDSKLEYLTNTEETHKAASLVVNRGVHGESGTDFSAVFNDVKAGPEPEVKDKVVSDTKPTNFEASTIQHPSNYPHYPPPNYYQTPPPPMWYQPPPPPYFYQYPFYQPYYGPPAPSFHGPVCFPQYGGYGYQQNQVHPQPQNDHGTDYLPPPHYSWQQNNFNVSVENGSNSSCKRAFRDITNVGPEVAVAESSHSFHFKKLKTSSETFLDL